MVFSYWNQFLFLNILACLPPLFLFIYSSAGFSSSHDLQKRVVDKEQEKQKILEETKELTEKNAKISQEMEKMNEELKNVEK